jgi:hypothetical protein
MSYNNYANLFIIIITIVIIYFHINNQYQKSEFVDIYEIHYDNNYILNQLCNVKQPFVFYRIKEITLINFTKNKQLLTIKNNSDYYKEKTTSENNDINKNNNKNKHNNININIVPTHGITVMCEIACNLMKYDQTSTYFSENNQQFIEESELKPTMMKIDKELQPMYTINTMYDLLLGSKNVTTPLRYHTSTSRFIYSINDTIIIKMASWKYTKYLKEIKDDYNTEYRSSINVWIDNDTNPNYNLLNNIQFIDVELKKGMILYIPPYWWYSIKYSNNESIVLQYTYITFINYIAQFDFSFLLSLYNNGI